MYRTQCVLALLALYVGLAHSFSWDIVLTGNGKLQFYNNNGTLTHTEVIPSGSIITSIAYDRIQNRVLFVESNGISSFDIATRKIQPLVKDGEYNIIRMAYDAATQLLFWLDEKRSRYSIYSQSGSNNTINRILFNLRRRPAHIAVDSCLGYIYWASDNHIERARFDGSEREAVAIDTGYVQRKCMVIDQETQKLYWLDIQLNNEIAIKSSDLNGENRRTLYNDKDTPSYKALTVSKDFIILGLGYTFWQIPKNPQRDRKVEPKLFLSIPNTSPFDAALDIASNYKIEDQTQGIQNCEALKSLLPINSVPNDYDSLNGSIAVSHSCVHGTKVSGESRCECTQGYSGERCDGSVWHNYCFQGDCSVSAEGKPKCRCNAGYSGDRCEINACHNYCLNNGVCSLNEESEPVCQCTGHYEGERCDVPAFLVKCLQTVSMLRDILNTDVTPVTLGKRVKSTCAATAV